MRTKGNSSARGKRKVFFSCHPDDFDRYFDMICDDIFGLQNCAIYYAKDTDPKARDQEETNLAFEEISLLVIPITYQLLTESNRALDEDFVYAKEHHIPILPIMVEKEIDEFYERKFDKIEYLNRLETDATSLGYANKLSKFLGAVLLNDEMTAKIRAAFEAYIFLSYRKKDRKYANELMRLIHRNPLCSDIAIWYDEYLMPGEDFEDTIKEALEKCNLFAMVVTPNITERGNYVLENEYPQARKIGKTILPVEMVDTDETVLKDLFEGIPESTKGTGDESFYRQILEILASKGKMEQKDDPEHNFLVGLAYLDGIDVEKDYERGIKMITTASDAGLLEAMEKLADIYVHGIGVETDLEKSRDLLQKAVKQAEAIHGPKDQRTLSIQSHLMEVYGHLFQLESAVELAEYIYETRKELLGEEHPDTLNSLRDFAAVNITAGNYQVSLEALEKVCPIFSKTLGDECPETILAYYTLAQTYQYLNDYTKGMEIISALYETCKKCLGERDILTLRVKQMLGSQLICLGDFQNAIELFQELYEEQQTYLKDERDAAFSLSFLGQIYGMLSDYEKAIPALCRAHEMLEHKLGPEHPETLCALQSVAAAYDLIGMRDEAFDINRKILEVYRRIYGEKNPLTLQIYRAMASSYGEKGDMAKAIDILKSVCNDLKEFYGEEHIETISAFHELAYSYGKTGNYEEGLKLALKTYELAKNTLGEDNQITLQTVNNIPAYYYSLGQFEKAVGLGTEAYENYKRVFGEEHMITHLFRLNIGKYYGGLGEYEKAIEILEEEYAKLSEMLGPENPEILPRKIFLVMAYAGKGEREKALVMGEELVEALDRVFGEDHPETLQVKQRLEELRKG